MEPNKDHNQHLNNLESSNSDSESNISKNDLEQHSGGLEQDAGTEEGYYSSPEDKYLALEQPGVTYTDDTNPTTLLSSDDIEDGTSADLDTWDPTQKNNRNSDAFNQDEFLLNDNLEIDPEDNTSISSEEN